MKLVITLGLLYLSQTPVQPVHGTFCLLYRFLRELSIFGLLRILGWCSIVPNIVDKKELSE